MLSSARLGDKHVCPLPGHGTTPIASASADTNINFMGVARVGDTCGCGAVITTGFPSIQVNGRPMAHLGSPTSHGGTIITGSEDTFGGFVFGDTSQAIVLNFAQLGAIRPDGTVDDERMATLLADPELTEKAIAVGAVVDPTVKSVRICNHPDRMHELADYIAGEMNRNIHHPSVVKMKELLSYDTAAETRKYLDLPWYAQAGATSPQTIAYANTTAALGLWTERVGQDRPWDHKPKIRATIGGIWHKQGKYEYFYDIWSNIHYGYVGMAGGLSESVLLDGAGIEQIGSDTVRKVFDWNNRIGPHRSADIEGARAFDDVADRVSISIGVKLYQEHPAGGITAKMIMDQVLAVEPTEWGDGIEIHKCN
ncbi:hypothetical protein C4K04_2719 [Pseudomonas chlororaphis]|uniref:Bacterial toxin 44 domain-containing protein n=1 Tax=Pseudomonas chlororaphis TaxID=587753 RepID=A0A3G7TND0_9PSED|nr:polymorphic toxin type 44 domain-containing protein [Pseudomonas chlororaphis]AZE48391.1 hypothetical protein C4K04_2719 [Pseudomonas chlororaphis]